jgi:hypothetical protein
MSLCSTASVYVYRQGSIKEQSHESGRLLHSATCSRASEGATVQPTTQPTKCDVLHDFRVLWQSPRSVKSLENLVHLHSHGGSRRFKSYCAHHLFNNPPRFQSSSSQGLAAAFGDKDSLVLRAILANQGDGNVVFAASLDGIHGFVSHANDHVQRIGRIQKSGGTDAEGDFPIMSFHLFEESQAKFAEQHACGRRVSLRQENGELIPPRRPT